jgi:hypothetical protein
MEESIMTNKTKLSAAALFSALVLGGTFATSTVFAAGDPNVTNPSTANVAHDGPNKANNGTVTEVGHAYATFTRNGGGQVKTPSDPGISYTPSNSGDITNETGSLTLDAIPSSLNFGSQETTGVAQTVQLLQSEGKDYFSGNKDGSTQDQTKDADGNLVQRTDSPNGAKTSDFGSGTAADGKKSFGNNNTVFTQVTNLSSSKDIAWTLDAKLSNFYKAGETASTGKDKSDNAIPGAFITLKGGKNVKDTVAADGTESWKNATDTITGDVKLEANTTKTIISASKDKGVFQQQWNVGNVTLTAPDGAPVGQYTADIDWTLSTAPVAQLDDAVAAPATDTKTGNDATSTSNPTTPEDTTKTGDEGTN